MDGARPKRVLLVRVGAMGDVLHALPAVSALRVRHPDWFLGWVVDPRWRPLLAGTGQIVDCVHDAGTQDWKRAPLALATFRSIFALRRELRAERYDLCVDLQGTLRSAAIGWLSGAPRRIGTTRPRERGALAFYTARVVNRARHVVNQACELTGAASSRRPQPKAERLEPVRITLPLDSTAEAWAAAQAQDAILLVPNAGWGAKQWPAERFAELAARLAQADLMVLINASSEDDPLARRIAETSGASSDRVQTIVCNVAELIALIRRTACVVGGDTGPVHLAAALGRPVVALFGATDPVRNGPAGFMGARATELRDLGSATSYKRRAGTDPGLARITVEAVFRAVQAHLVRNPRPAERPNAD